MSLNSSHANVSSNRFYAGVQSDLKLRLWWFLWILSSKVELHHHHIFLQLLGEYVYTIKPHSDRSRFESRLHLFDSKYSKNCNIVKYSFNLKWLISIWIHFKKWIYSCSCIFNIVIPVFSVTWSSEIIIICSFAAQETFIIIIITVNNSWTPECVCENSDTFFSII